jgi:AraC-like DNA-binding protein
MRAGRWFTDLYPTEMERPDQNGTLYAVEESLKEVVNHYYHVYNFDGGPVIKHLSPNLEIMLIFNFGTPVHISFNQALAEYELKKGCLVLGPLRKMLNYELNPGADAIIVNFKLNGFYRLFKVPVNELNAELLIDPDTLTDKHRFADLWQELSNLTDLQTRLTMISSYAIAFMDENDQGVKPLLNGEHYFYNPAVQPVKAIADDTQLTERTIQLRFAKYAGYSPKELLRFLRFKMVVERLMNDQDKTTDMFDIIVAFGYHDQSHLIKDFKHFLGTTPQYFIKKLKDKEFYVAGQGKKNAGDQ